MDPISMVGSAVNVLNKVKDELKKCEAAFAAAAELNKSIELFEVTIMMIPNRTTNASTTDECVLPSTHNQHPDLLNNATVNQPLSHSIGVEDTVNPMVAMHDRVAGHGTELTSFVGGAVVNAGMKAIEDTPLQLVADLFTIGQDGEPIFNEGPSPAETLRDMKNLMQNGLRVHSDLEVMFAGMAFIISQALRALHEATGTFKEMDAVGQPSCMWLLTPWKMQQIKALNEALAGHTEMLKNQTAALQSAISVASYAVQLEQLENVLDATSAFQHLDMKDFWKKKIGSDKTRVTMAEFCEVFLARIEDGLKVARSSFHIAERINRMKFPSEVALTRFLNELFNSNCDADLTVYELSQALTALGIKPSQSTIRYTLNELVQREKEFLRSIHFSIVPSDLERSSGENENEVDHEKTPAYSVGEDGIIRVKPFHRFLIHAEVPVMDMDDYEFDHLVMLKYSKDPRSLIRRSYSKPVEFALTVMKYSKSYVHPLTSEMLVSKNDNQWNAFHHFHITRGGKKERLTSIPGFPHGVNWVEIRRDEHVGTERKSDTKTDASSVNGEEKGSKHTRILYTPYLLSPGFFTPRYCLDAYVAKHEVGHRELAKSQKSYYRGGLCRSENTVHHHQVMGSQRRLSLKPGMTPHAPQPFTVKEENVGMIVECVDELEMVWAEDETFACDSDDEEEGTNNKKKAFYMPLLFEEYPYLPDRELILSGPDKVKLFVNVPSKKKREKDTEDGSFSEISKFGIFFEGHDELISPSAVFAINEHESLHTLNLEDIFEEPELQKALQSAHKYGEGCLEMIVGFLAKDGKSLLRGAPSLILKFLEDYESSSDESDDESSDDEYGDGDSTNELDEEAKSSGPNAIEVLLISGNNSDDNNDTGSHISDEDEPSEESSSEESNE